MLLFPRVLLLVLLVFGIRIFMCTTHTHTLLHHIYVCVCVYRKLILTVQILVQCYRGYSHFPFYLFFSVGEKPASCLLSVFTQLLSP